MDAESDADAGSDSDQEADAESDADSDQEGDATDTTAPEISIFDAPPATTYETSVSVGFECANEEICTFECALDYDDGVNGVDNGAWQPCSSVYVFDELEAGDYKLFILATDEFGNESMESVIWSVLEADLPTGDWKGVDTGYFHSCAIATEGTLWCWGSGGIWRLGLGDIEAHESPQKVGEESDWKMVSGNIQYTCGVRENGTLWCWGANDEGQLGQGDNYSRIEPTQVGADTDGWSFVTTGSDHGCGLRDDESLWCWGRNNAGQLGLNSTDDHLLPQQVDADGELDWTALATGSMNCALRADNTLWCWGWGFQGRLGMGDTDNRHAPTQVGDHEDWIDISTNYRHSCAIREDGSMWCWGPGGVGQLGTGETDTEHAPVLVVGDTNWKSLSAGEGHTCGIRDDDSLWCWGWAAQGALGIGDTDNLHSPEMAVNDATWTFVSAGSRNTCRLQSDGSLWCWGYGHVGQLGLGDTDNRDRPDEVLLPVE